MAAEAGYIHWAEGESDLGSFLLGVSDAGICALKFIEQRKGLADAPAARWIGAVAAAIARPGEGRDIPLAPRGTDFQKAVWQAVCAIPAGETRTYQFIASLLGRPSAARAVGRANGTNPIAVLIPCHRLVRGNGALAGYAYGLDRKQALLDKERNYKDERGA